MSQQYKNTKPRYLPKDTVIHQKFKVEKIIGSGGFGEIYKAVDDMTNIAVAIKVSPMDYEPGRMILEQQVLFKLRGCHHVPQFIASGTHGNYFYIMMEILGRNLSDLKKRSENKKFSPGTVLRVGQQMLLGIKAIHDIGYLHRDIKPSNMCTGLGGMNKRIIYIVDFGMTRQYRYDKHGGFRRERSYAAFRGTMRYASIRAHERKEQGPADDFWSLYYTLIELVEGSLPWKSLSVSDEIRKLKEDLTFQEMCKSLPKSFENFPHHLEELQYGQLPNYSLLSSILQKALPDDVTSETPFDWEE